MKSLACTVQSMDAETSQTNKCGRVKFRVSGPEQCQQDSEYCRYGDDWCIHKLVRRCRRRPRRCVTIAVFGSKGKRIKKTGQRKDTALRRPEEEVCYNNSAKECGEPQTKRVVDAMLEQRQTQRRRGEGEMLGERQ